MNSANNMIFISLLSIPILVACVTLLFSAQVRFVRTVSIVGSVLFFIFTLLHALTVYALGRSTLLWFTFDAIGALMALIVGWVFMTAIIVSDRYLSHDQESSPENDSRFSRYHALAHLFALAMAVMLFADHMILAWIALEGSTLATTLLVAHNDKRRSLEAAWKYIVLCSTGLLVGLLGILIFSMAFAGGDEVVELTFSHFANSYGIFNPLLVKVAFILLLVGIGTKVGLVPMHNWLPDAHGETPAPISAMLSGVLLSVALIFLVRFKFIVDGLLGDASWTNMLFVIFGTASVLYAALLMVNQKNYKRLLAYSSIEHMGITLFGFALGPIGAAASVLHIIGHAILKPLLFFASGEVLHAYHTTSIQEVRGLSVRLQKTSTLFFVGLIGLLAMPPSVLFLSEIIILSQGVGTYLVPTILVGLGLVIASYGLLFSFFEMNRPSSGEKNKGGEHLSENWNVTHGIMLLQMVLVVLLFAFALSPIGQELLVVTVGPLVNLNI